MRPRLARLLARCGLAGFLAGIPLLLGELGFPPRLPSYEGVSWRDVPPEAVTDTVAMGVWVFWSYAAVAILLRARAVARARGEEDPAALRRLRARLLPSGLRGLVDLAIGGAFLAVSLTGHRGLSDTRSQARPVASVHATDRAEVAERGATYVVRKGDNLWEIAERTLGEGQRARDIFAANRGRRFPGGGRLVDPDHIEPGWSLKLPRPAAASEPTTRAARNKAASPHRSHRRSSPPKAASSKKTTARAPAPHRRSPALPRAIEPGPAHPVVRLPSGAVVAGSFAAGILGVDLLVRLLARKGWRPLEDDLPAAEGGPLVGALRAARPTGAIAEKALEALARAWCAHTGRWPRVLLATETPEAVEFVIDPDGCQTLPERSGGAVSPLVRFARRGATVLATVKGPFAGRPPSLSALERCLLVPLGHRGDARAVHACLLGLGVISLTGAHHQGLLRQAVTHLATTAGAERVPLTLLSDDSACRGLPGQQVVRTVGWDRAGEVIEDLQREFLRRGRRFQAESVGDIWGHMAARPDDPLPPLVVLSDPPPASIAPLVGGIASEIATFGGAFVALGWEPPVAGMRVEVGTELRIQSAVPCPARLHPFTLGAEDAAEALGIVAHAREEYRALEGINGWDGGEGKAGSDLLVLPLPATHSADREEPAAGAGDRDDEGLPPAANGDPGEAEGEDENEIAPAVPLRPAAQQGVATGAMPVASGDSVALPGPGPSTIVGATALAPERGLAPELARYPAHPPPERAALYLLGSLEVHHAGRPIPKGWRERSLSILAFLAVNPHGVTKDRIVETLWGEEDPPRKASREFNRLTFLARAQLRERGGTASYILTKRDVFRLESDAWWVDALAFEHLVSTAERWPNPTAAEAALRRAVEMYRGEFCIDQDWVWLTEVREHYGLLLTRALTRLGELRAAGGDPTEALWFFDRAIATQPLCEDLWRRAVRIEAEAGNRAAGLARIAQLKELLSAELGVGLDPATEALERKLRDPRGGPLPR